MTLRTQIRSTIGKFLQTKWPDAAAKVTVDIALAPSPRFGDYASSVAMRLAPILRQSPLAIAEQIAGAFADSKSLKASVAPPGFVNITIQDPALKRLTGAILTDKKFGNVEIGKGERVQVEFISANPTGPLHLGNGRGAFVGDVLANVLAAAGYKVAREYYVNDRGKQVDTLAESVIRRYFQQQGIIMDYPEYCYQGEYVTELARGLKIEGATIGQMNRLRNSLRRKVLNIMLKQIQELVENRLHIKFDRWFKETELYEQKLDERVLAKLQELELLEEREGAKWMKTTQFGDDKDRVLIKSDGEKTYFLSDVAYINDKFTRRKFVRAIVLLGADHHGYVGRLKAATKALGHGEAFEVIIMQLVRLIKNGEEVRMSKRAGNFVTLDELVDEVGPDVARFFFLMQNVDTHMDFDLDLAKEHSEKNPVFYVQYAHARISSLIAKAKPLLRKKGVTVKGEFGDEERALLRELARLPDVVEDAARSYAVQQLPQYALALARAFHDYYDKARIIDEDKVNLTRLSVVQATQKVLARTLSLMGVSAPEKM